MKKGEIMSDVQKEKIRLSNVGLKRSALTRKRIGLSKKGKSAPHMIGNTYGKGEKSGLFGKFGKEHPCWRENKKRSLYKSIRETFKYRQWRSDIFTRDDYTCVLCGVRDGSERNADHFPKRFIDIIRDYDIKTIEQSLACEELWNINNGRTLCRPCHLKTDTWGRRKK